MKGFKRIFSSLYRKSLFFVILIVLVAVLTILSAILLNIRSSVMKEYRQLVQASLQNADSSFAQYMDSAKTYSVNIYASACGTMSRLDEDYSPAHISAGTADIRRMFKIMSYLRSVSVITRENKEAFTVFNNEYPTLKEDFGGRLIENLDRAELSAPFLWTIKRKYHEDESSTLLCVFYRDSAPDTQYYRGTIAINIDTAALSEIIFKNSTTDSNFLILDTYGNVVAHTDTSRCGENLMSTAYVPKIMNGIFHQENVRIDNKTYEISAIHSSVPGFYIAAEIDYGENLSSKNSLVKILIYIALATAVLSVIGGSFIFRLLFRSYNKVVEMAKQSTVMENIQTGLSDDVEVLKIFYNETSEYIRWLKEKEQKNDIISGILKKQNTEQMLLDYNYITPGGKCMAVMIHINNIGEKTPHISDYDLARENVNKLIASAVKSIGKPVLFELSFNKILLIINLTEPENEIDIHLISAGLLTISERFGYTLTAIASEVLDLQEKGVLLRQYELSENIYKTAHFLETKKLLLTTERLLSDTMFEEMEEKILNMVKNRERDAFLSETEHLLGYLVNREWEDFLEIAAELIFKIIKIGNNVEITSETYYQVRQRVYQLECRDELLGFFGDCFSHVEDWLEVTFSNPSAPVLERTVEYINVNYMDKNINLNIISEEFHISPAYLGKIFHEFVGMSFNEYLLKKRMEQASVLLLLNPSEKIAEIAEKTGYANITYFTTSFKNYYGVTPSKYRSLRRNYEEHPLFENIGEKRE